MNDLLRELVEMKISGHSASAALWQRCIDLIEKTYVPQRLIGTERPCNEKDFLDYRSTLLNNLKEIQYTIQQILVNNSNDNSERDKQSETIKIIGLHLIVIIGEQSEENVWNTNESLRLSQDLLLDICKLFEADSLPQILGNHENLSAILIMLRPKLLKDTWKTFPATVMCYKWMLSQVEVPGLSNHVSNILPTALIIFDDYIPENRIIGLECIYRIIQHSSMQREFVDNGYADVVYDALEKLTHQREVKYIIPLYTCITHILASIEYHNKSLNNFEWTKRDDVIATLLDNMELEQDLELRHAYMSSLPQLLTDLGCARWCERLTRILSEYCSHHTDLRTLKATLLTAETVLAKFPLRIPAHCTTLYSAFLKLHFDLTETPVFDKEIMQSFQRCLYTLYNLTPSIGSALICDDRMKMDINNSLHLSFAGDTKYCN